ncbi:NUDIX domain-containing protein [Streptomyces sp. MH13]|uniref:NUDIX domain-containing protein n=1 Tax=Streptomyces sp. MH13 TaxID=3417651 RepID=UPI003CFA22E2
MHCATACIRAPPWSSRSCTPTCTAEVRPRKANRASCWSRTAAAPSKRPGGSVKAGESFEDTVVRELAQETGMVESACAPTAGVQPLGISSPGGQEGDRAVRTDTHRYEQCRRSRIA